MFNQWIRMHEQRYTRDLKLKLELKTKVMKCPSDKYEGYPSKRYTRPQGHFDARYKI